MTFLLDVNVLFVLHQPRHSSYKLAEKWFRSRPQRNFSFATCPITQAGMMRLLVQGLQGLTAFSMEEAQAALKNLTNHRTHVYWPDAPAYLEAVGDLSRRMQGHRQITDAYLLGLAKHYDGRLATLDKAIVSLAGPELKDFVELIL